MQVTFVSRGSPNAIENEDFIAATTSVVVVLDGISDSAEFDNSSTRCTHGTAWFVQNLGIELIKLMDTQKQESPVAILAQAIANSNAFHGGCDLNNPNNPAAEVAVLRDNGRTVDYLLLGSSTILLQDKAGIRVITDHRSECAVGEKGEPTGGHQQPRCVDWRLPPAVMKELSNGTRKISTNPFAAFLAYTGSTSRHGLQRAELLTKGVTRLVDVFELMDWPDLFDLIINDGPATPIDRVRSAERSDPAGQRWPRTMVFDDATAVLCEFRNRD